MARRRAPLLLAAFVAASFAVHHPALRMSWANDDLGVLGTGLSLTASELLFSPAAYRTASTGFFTPLQPLSLALDHLLFGLSPAGFYVHQLVALGLLCGAVCLLVGSRPWFAGPVAGMLLVTSPPAAIAAEALMLRHYIEGGLLSLAAALAFVGAARHGRPAIAAAALALAAMLCKEVWVPLALASPLFAGSGWRRRLRVAAPVLGAVAIYATWRLWMVGTATAYETLNWTAALRPARLLAGLRGLLDVVVVHDPPPFAAAAVAVAAVGVVAAAAARPGGRRWLAVLGLGLVPLLPAWNVLVDPSFIGLRLGFHLAVIAAVGAGVLLARRSPRRPGLRAALAAAAAAAVAGSILQGQAVAAAYRREIRANAAELRFLLEQPSTTTLVATVSPTNVGSAALVRRLVGRGPPPETCTFPLDLRDSPATTYFRYDADRGEIVDFTAGMRNGIALFRQRLADLPFRVELDIDARAVARAVLDGGEAEGTYALLLGNQVYEMMPIPAVATYRFAAIAEPTWFRFLKVTPTGQAVLSPQWQAAMDQPGSWRWSRDN